MIIRTAAFALIAACQFASGQTSAPQVKPATVDEAVELMAGAFSSADQAAKDPSYFDIRLHMAPIWPEEAEGKWLYVEQAMSSVLDRPYRQRVYHVSAQSDGTIKSEVFMLPGDPLKYAGAWKKPELLGDLKVADLKFKDGCSVTLKKTTESVFDGGTDGKSCASDLRGAAYATSEVHMSKEGLKTWDRGYDKEDHQVWGAVNGGYIFKRVSVEESETPPAPKPEVPKPEAPKPAAEAPKAAEPAPHSPSSKPELIHPAQDPANPK